MPTHARGLSHGHLAIGVEQQLIIWNMFRSQSHRIVPDPFASARINRATVRVKDSETDPNEMPNTSAISR
jgi:hypothetical protein